MASLDSEEDGFQRGWVAREEQLQCVFVRVSVNRENSDKKCHDQLELFTAQKQRQSRKFLENPIVFSSRHL